MWGLFHHQSLHEHETLLQLVPSYPQNSFHVRSTYVYFIKHLTPYATRMYTSSTGTYHVCIRQICITRYLNWPFWCMCEWYELVQLTYTCTYLQYS